MQAIAATARDGIIKRELQVVVSKEPVESRPSFFAPAVVTSYEVRLQTSGNRAGRFNWLLIEAGPFITLAVKSMRTDGHKVAVHLATLCFHKPIQCFETSGNHMIIGASRSHEQPGLGQPGVPVCHNT